MDRRMNEVEDLKDIAMELRSDNKEYQEELHRLRYDAVSMNMQRVLVEEDLKEIEDEMFILKQHIFALQEEQKRLLRMNNKQRKGHSLDFANWDKWDGDQIIEWFISLENKKYMKYEKDLVHRLPMERIKGNELYMVNEEDLMHFGVYNENDRKGLLQNIKLLVNGKWVPHAMELSPPPMAFMKVDQSIPDINMSPRSVISLEGGVVGSHLSKSP